MDSTEEIHNDPIRVLLVDAQVVVRAGLRLFLERRPEFEIAGETEDGETALELIQSGKPQIVISDISVPKINGFEISRQIHAHRWPVHTLIFTSSQDDIYIQTFLKSGANGYLLKTASEDEIIDALKDINNSKSYIDKNILHKVLSQASSPSLAMETLTEREIEIITLVAKGLTNKLIGYRLNISDRTVQGHIARIFEKMHATSRTDAVMRAIANGTIQSPETSGDEFYSYEI
jgi:NarL family two-component system response regulator LiaR